MKDHEEVGMKEEQGGYIYVLDVIRTIEDAGTDQRDVITAEANSVEKEAELKDRTIPIYRNIRTYERLRMNDNITDYEM